MASRHFMNPQMGRHMQGQSADEADDVEEESGQHKTPHIHVHSHSKGHTVHVMHHDGGHSKHQFSHGDSEGIANLIHKHIGGGEGQDHGVSDDEGMEDEIGAGGPGV
jgi:hypothetical protein